MAKRGFTIWFTGLLCSGKTTLSGLVHHTLQENGITNVEVLDGDVVNTHLTKGIGFTKEDLDTNILRIGWVAQLLTKHNVPNLVSAVSPYREARGEVRKMIEHVGGKGSFVEVFVDCPLELCEERDTAGLYARARKGGLKQFTGVDEPYEQPHAPDVHVQTGRAPAKDGAQMVIEYLRKHGLVSF